VTTTPPLGAAVSGPASPRQPVPRQVQLPQVPARPVRSVPLQGVPRQAPHGVLPRQARRLPPTPRPPRSDLASSRDLVLVPGQDVTDLIPVVEQGPDAVVVLGHPLPSATDLPDPVGPPRRVVFWRGTTRWLRQALRP
jgi:hypothetical protein